MIARDAYGAIADEITADEGVRLTRALVDTPSPTGQELECARFLTGYLRESGVEADLQPLGPTRANVIARVEGSGTGPTIMLNGHLDTTFYGSDDDRAVSATARPNDMPHSFVVDGGVYGLGAFNMKGGVAAISLALRAFQRAGVRLAGDLMVSAVAGESEKAPVGGVHQRFEGPKYTGSGFGTRHLLAHCPPLDYAIVAEPSDLYVVNGQAGYLFVRCRISGQTAYLAPVGSQGAQDGIDAIRQAYRLSEGLAEWGERYAESNVFDTGLGVIRPLLTLGAVEGGWPFFPSIVSGNCHLYMSIRVTPAQRPSDVMRDLRALLAGSYPDIRCSLDVYASNVPSTVTPADSVLCRTAVSVMEDVFGHPTRPFGRGEADPSNDSNQFRRHGIPAIKCGPRTRTEPNAHEMDRRYGTHVYVDDVVTAARFYVRLALELNAVS